MLSIGYVVGLDYENTYLCAIAHAFVCAIYSRTVALRFGTLGICHCSRLSAVSPSACTVDRNRMGTLELTRSLAARTEMPIGV